jgi:hypothetical protein
MTNSVDLAVTPSEFRRLSVNRLNTLLDSVTEIIAQLRYEKDPDYRKLAGELSSIRLAVGQVEYSFEEIAKFLESLSDKVNSIKKEKA